MKLTITTEDVNIQYEDEQSVITDEAKKCIIEIMRSLPIPPKPIFYPMNDNKNK